MKERALLTNKEVVRAVYDELKLMSDWFNKYNVEVTETRNIYDHRDVVPMSYLLVDFDSISEDKREETYKNELEKLQKAFDTLDPKTGRPYPEAIKPYLKRIYTETAGRMSYDVDWNDKKEVMKFTRAMILMQTVGTMIRKFPQEYYEIFPDAQERRKIDNGIMQNQAMYNRASEILKREHKLDFQSINQLTLFSVSQTNMTRFEEYFDYTSSQALFANSSDIVFDPSVDPILNDYFSGIEVDTEQFNEDFDEIEPYDTDCAGTDVWKAMQSIVKSAHAEWVEVDQFDMGEADHILINGRSLTELVEESGHAKTDKAYLTAAKFVREAFKDGRSRVELAKFTHDDDGNIKFDYRQLKLDLSKLSKRGSITNSTRDKNQSTPESLREQELQHLRFERKYKEKFEKGKQRYPLLAAALPKFKFSDRLEVFEVYEKLEQSDFKNISASRPDKMLECSMLADRDSDYKTPENFNAFEHLESHKVDPTTVAGNINFVVNGIAGREQRTVEQKMAIIRAAQMAAYKYMIVNPTPDTPDDKAAHDALKMMIDKPEKAFASIMSKELIKELRKVPSMKEYTNALMSEGKEMLNAARAEARAAEENYNRRVEELNKRLEDAKNKLVFEQDEKKTLDLIAEQNTLEEGLKTLRNAEIERLEQAYANGKLPLDYFEQRRVDVEQGKHDRKVPFGSDERPSFKQFKAENAEALEGMSSSDIKFMYNNMIENARREENKFILNSVGNKPEPVAESSVSITNKEQTEAPKREHISVTDAMDKKIDTVSAKIDDSQPVISKEPELK